MFSIDVKVVLISKLYVTRSDYEKMDANDKHAYAYFCLLSTEQSNLRTRGGGTNPASTSHVGSSKYKIGDFAEGGVVIWLTEDGQHGLVAAIDDLPGTYQWSPDGDQDTTSATQNNAMPLNVETPAYNSFSGYYDTHTIIQYYTDNPVTGNPTYAALAAASYSKTVNGVTYADWFLPSDA
jgi:hypothetical protein